MKIFFIIPIVTFLMNYTLEFKSCPKSSKPPQKVAINTSYTINPIIYNNDNYTAVKVGNKIFLNKSNGKITMATSGHFSDSEFCPKDFKIPLKEDYESLIKQLGKNAYSVFTDPNGFNMQPNIYYLTNTIGQEEFSKVKIYLDGKNIKFIENAWGDTVCRCMLVIHPTSLNYTNKEGEINLNQKTVFTIDNNHLNGYLWKIEDTIFSTKSVEYTFKNSGRHHIELWGNLINGESIYYCEYVFVKKLSVSSSQQYDDSKVKIIETDFEMTYNPLVITYYSNSPVAPRIDGGYYVSFADKNEILHVLSYDKDDNLLKDFITNEKAYPFDITATDYGFAIYVVDADHTGRHSYLSLYNKKFELINTVQIMNNDGKNSSKDSNINYQVIQYNSDGTPVSSIRYMDRPSGGKLAYSRGRIFLVFSHYNDFLAGGWHEGDSVVTFNDLLQDLDFGPTWSPTHSLLQSVTFDENYFWSATLGDDSLRSVSASYTSKANIRKDVYDPINKKYNYRVFGWIVKFTAIIKGDNLGHTDGKLGRILYFEKHNLYCLIYANTPNHLSEDKNGKNIIYMTTWEFDKNTKTHKNNRTIEVKTFENEAISNIRAGKYGDDNVFIIYSFEPKNSKNFGVGFIEKGTIPYLCIFDISKSELIKDGIKMDKFVMNTNEDIKTFNDGVLIWASTNKEGKLIIQKIGTPLLNEKYDDINYILTKNDLVKEEGNNENNDFYGTKAIIIISVIIVSLILIFSIYILIRRQCRKKTDVDINSLPHDKLIN